MIANALVLTANAVLHNKHAVKPQRNLPAVVRQQNPSQPANVLTASVLTASALKMSASVVMHAQRSASALTASVTTVNVSKFHPVSHLTTPRCLLTIFPFSNPSQPHYC